MRFTCIEGYRMEGSPTLNCISEGMWDVTPPTCVQVDCGPPPTGDSIVIQGSHTVYGSQVTMLSYFIKLSVNVLPLRLLRFSSKIVITVVNHRP